MSHQVSAELHFSRDSQSRIILVMALLCMSVFPACDSSDPMSDDLDPGPDPDPIEYVDLPVYQDDVPLVRNQIKINQRPNGSVWDGQYVFDHDGLERQILFLYQTGLGLAIDDGVVRANAAANAGFANRFELITGDTDSLGLFVLTHDDLKEPIGNWPTELGAPSGPDGQPLMYGDLMAWGAYRPFQSPSSTEPVLQGIRVDLTTFLRDEFRHTNVVFMKVGITNTSDETIRNLHAGYSSDPDVSRFGNVDLNLEDCPLYYGENQVGYDLERNLSYVYNSRGTDRYDPLPDWCFGIVGGYAFLDSSDPLDIGGDVLAHRVMRSSPPETYPEFSEEYIHTAQEFFYALQGLSNSGNPMFHPDTGEQSLFAFTGDPVARTGWLDDDRDDVKQLISLRPFDLAPGERKHFTVIWIMANGDSLQHGLNRLGAFYDLIASRPDVWDY